MRIKKVIGSKNINVKKATVLFSKITIFVFFIVTMIVGSYVMTNKFLYSYKLGIEYVGGYKVQVDVFNTSSINYDPTIPNGDNKKGLDLLKNKLDPLNNNCVYLKTLGNHAIELITGKENFGSYNNLKNIIQRLGALHLTNSNGEDLLVNDNERIPLNNVIYEAKAEISINRKPVITLKIKDNDRWNLVINKLNSKENGQYLNNKLCIWTDIGQFIDSLRHDSQNLKLIARNFQFQIIDKIKDSNIRKKIRNIFNIEYKDIHSGKQIRHDNLLSMTNNFPLTYLKEIINDDSFKFTDVKLENLVIDSNKKDNIKNDYIDPLRPYLLKILDWSKEINDKYSKFLLNYNSLKSKDKISKFQNEIYTRTETEAKKISNLVNSGLSGLRFMVRGYSNIMPIITTNTLIILRTIMYIICTIIIVYLTIYYRLFGIILIIALFTTIICMLYLSSLLGIQISTSSITATLIILGLALESNLLLFSKYKHERYNNKLLYESAMKIANKQTIITFLDLLVMIIILGLSLFWVGTNNIKSFATILLIGLISLFVISFFITRLIYWIVIELKWQLKVKWLDIPNLSFFSLLNLVFNKRKEVKVKNNEFENNLIESIIHDNYSEKKYLDINKVNNNLIKNNKYLLFTNLVKIIPLIGIVLFVFAFIITIFGKANIDSSIKSGTNFIIYSNNWQSSDQNKEIEFISKMIDDFRSDSRCNFVYNVYVISAEIKDQGKNILVVSTNITKSSISRELLTYIATMYGSTPEDPGFSKEITNSLMDGYILKISVISLITGIICVFIYTLFRFNWTQFIGILSSSIFTLSITLSFVIIFHILITFEMIIIFISVFIFSCSISAIVISQAKQYQKIISDKEYRLFFTLINDNKYKIKFLKKEHKIFIKEKVQEIELKNSNLHKKMLKQKYRNELKQIYQDSYKVKRDNKIKIKQNKEKIKNFNYIFFKKIIYLIIKQIIWNYLLLEIILMIFTIFSGIFFEFVITIIIGIIMTAVSSLFISLPIWVVLEKYKILIKIKLKNYFDSRRVKIDEQIIPGVN